MSLNWNISKVRNWQKKQEKDGHTLECLIWASLTIGMGDLNEKTAKEFLYRLNRYSPKSEQSRLTGTAEPSSGRLPE